MKSNHRAALDAATAFSLHIGLQWRGASEHGRSANEHECPNA